MQILIVTHSLASGGTDRVAVHLANGFVQWSRVTLLNVRRPGPNAPLTGMISADVERVALDVKRGGRFLELLTSVPALVRAVRRLRPDVIMATGNNNSLYSLVGHLWNPNPHGRFFVKITNPIVRARDGWFKRGFRLWLYGIVLGRADGVLVLSRGERDVVARLYPHLASRVRIVCNPYVTPAMLALGHEHRRPCGTEFLVIGRLHHQKNIPLLLRAWALAAIPDGRLRIAGDGPMRAQLEALADQLGISGSVEFLGFRRDVPALLEESDCLVLSSDYEGLPAVVLEAFAAGRKVVSTDCFPEASELVGTAPGCVVVPCRDLGALADALRGTVNASHMDTIRLKERARPYAIDEAVRSHFDVIAPAAI